MYLRNRIRDVLSLELAKLIGRPACPATKPQTLRPEKEKNTKIEKALPPPSDLSGPSGPDRSLTGDLSSGIGPFVTAVGRIEFRVGA